MKLVAYLRTSTDDGSQDATRQAETIAAWASSNRVEICHTVTDEGTSGATSPLGRAKVREAIRVAKANGAEGIVVEAADRWTRGGVEDGVLSRAGLLQEHRLQLFMCDIPFGMDSMIQQVMVAVRDAMAEDWLRRHKARVSQGLRRAKAKGFPNGKPGQPPKEPLNLDELGLVLNLIDQGDGTRKISHAISKHRRAFDVADPKRRRQLSVSEAWIRRELARHAQGNADVRRRVEKAMPALLKLKLGTSSAE